MTPPVSGDPLTIGYANAGVSPFGSPFDGLIDDVQIHNVALDARAILELAGDSCRLVSHWAGEDNAEDSVGPNSGAEQGGISYAQGQVGRAFSIDGLDDRNLVPSSASLSSYQDFTYSFWIKSLGVTHGGWQQILAKRAPGSDRSPGVWNCPTTAGSTTVSGIHWRTTPGNPGALCLGPNGENTNFELNQWYHLAGVKEGATLKVYIDGVQVGVTYPAAAPMTQGAGNIYIGRSESYLPVNAWIDEVKLYNYALPASDIDAEFQESNTPADTTQPVVTVPDDFSVEATGPGGAEVTFAVSAEDAADGSVAVTCTQESGAPFPLGETVVECTAEDAAENTSSASFTVTVEDTTAPVLSIPGDLTVTAEGVLTVVNIGVATAVDIVDPAPSVANDAPAAFPLGATTVIWTRTDAAGNQSSGQQTVTVLGAQDLKNTAIAGLTPYSGDSKKIEKAIKEINKSLEKDWIDQLHLEAKHGKKVFDHEDKAVKELLHVLKDVDKGKVDVDGETINTAIRYLVAADSLLAQVALDEANAIVQGDLDPKTAEKVAREIDKSEKEMAKAQEELDKDKPDKAIDRFKKAWEHAVKAAREAGKGT